MRSPTRARLTFATLTCAAAVALVGCASSPTAPALAGGTASTSVSAAPSPTPTPTPSATTGPTPTTSVSSTPTTGGHGGTTTTGGVAKGPAAAAAQKAAQAFVAGDNVATRTGAYGARDEVTASSCAWCARKKSFVTAIYRGGGHIQGELFTKNTFTVTDPTKGVYTVVVNTTVSKYREVSGSGKVLDSHGDRTGLLVVHVSGSTLKVVFASWQPGS